MKKFYIINGQNQEGPLDLEQLKQINIKKDTPIWYEGIENWTTAEKVEDLKSILPNISVPPKYENPSQINISTQPPIFNSQEQPIVKKVENQQSILKETKNNSKSNTKRNLIVIGALLFGAFLLFLIRQNSDSNYSTSANPEASAAEAADANYEINSAEYQKENANAALTQKNMNYRNNFEKYLSLSRNQYEYSELGGIYNLEITFTNNTDYVINNANVQVGYIKENGEYYKTEDLQFTNIQPNTQETLRAPDSERGLNVDYQFSEIYSKKMHFYYPSNSGNEADPYFYK